MRSALLVLATVLLSAGCVRPAIVLDQYAQPELVWKVVAKEEKCARHVEVLRSVPEGAEVVADLSATCDPLDLGACSRGLVQRACELGADAVVIPPEPGAQAELSDVPGSMAVVNRKGTAVRAPGGAAPH